MPSSPCELLCGLAPQMASHFSTPPPPYQALASPPIPSPHSVLSPQSSVLCCCVSMEMPLCLFPGLPLVRTALATFFLGGGTVSLQPEAPHPHPALPTTTLCPCFLSGGSGSRAQPQARQSPWDRFLSRHLGCLSGHFHHSAGEPGTKGPLMEPHTGGGRARGAGRAARSQRTVATGMLAAAADTTRNQVAAPTCASLFLTQWPSVEGPAWRCCSGLLGQACGFGACYAWGHGLAYGSLCASDPRAQHRQLCGLPDPNA